MQTLEVGGFETPLRGLGRLIDWQLFAPQRPAAVALKARGPGGRPRGPPLLLFKGLVRPRRHGLAEAATALQSTARHSLRAFLGRTPGEALPAGQTLRDCRQTLREAQACAGLFETFLSHWQKPHGLALARQGGDGRCPLLRRAPAQRHRREENAPIKAGAGPPGRAGNPEVRAPQDRAARWTRKN